MFYKCFMCFVFVVLPIECLFKGDSCTADHRPGTCKQLSKCTHLMNEIRHCGTPMPSHMRDKLKRLGCGFDYDEPLVCCDSSSNTAYTQKPFTSTPGDRWGSHAYGKEDRYDKGPHYDVGNDWTTSKPNSNTWGSGEAHGSGTWGSSGSHGSGTWGSSGSHGSDTWGSGGSHGSDTWGSGESGTGGSSESDTWGSSANRDPYNTGGGKDPYANNGGNSDDRNNNNKWDSNKNTVDNSIERIPDVRNHRNLDLLPIECGAIEGERIFGGNRTKLFEMPWMVLLSYDSVFKGDSCTADHRPGTCKQLSKCTHLMNEIRHCGTPMPSHMRDKLKRLGCGFDYDEPLVCCDSSSNTAYTQKPFTSTPGDRWGSHAYGKEDRYDKGPHYDVGNDWTTSKPNSNTWGSGEAHGSGTWGSSGSHGSDTWGSGESGTGGSSESDTWGSSANRDPYNTGGGKDPYANNGGNSDDRNNNNKWDSNKNTVDNSIERIPDVRNHRNLDLLPIECGAIEGERIFGGNRTKLFEMPWMVLLSYDSARGTKLSCGGTLITEWYVLTAAHCVSFLGTKLKLRSVILGEYDVRRDPDCERMEGELFCAPKVRNVAVDTLIPHPNYSPQRLGDDIGLIRLAEPADFTLDSMKSICLPTSPELQSENLEGLNGVVAGWGATEDGLQSPVLLSVDLPIISNRDCQAIYNGSPRIDKSQLCAGGIRDKDSCGGDSGGPLLYPGRTRAGVGVRYVQRGIVSYGSKRCGLGGFPGVYTRVANYMDWILDNIR